MLCLIASVLWALTKRVPLDVKNVKIAEVLSAIEKQTSYMFNYRNGVFDANKELSVSVKNETVFNAIAPAAPGFIDVLKDASATAIYGARGANGIIVAIP